MRVVVAVLGSARALERSIDARDALADQGALLGGWPTVVWHGLGSLLRHLRDDLLNAMVGAAATEIAAHSATNVFSGGLRVLLQKCFGSNHEAWSAESALRGVVVHKCLLHRMQFVALHQRLDRRNRLARSLDSQHRAGVNGLAVNQHSARAALAAIADALGAGDVEMIAQGVK